ncbi:MAG: GAF and ANTAR domain-containing protein [Mycobacterium sp.]
MTEFVLEVSDATELALTLIEITNSVTQGAETIEIFTELAEKCVNLLPVSAAGIMLRDVTGTLQVIGASSRSAHLLDLFQVQNEEGPCLECTMTGVGVSDVELSAEGKWPRFAELAQSHSFTAVYALPLRSRDVTVGALNLFAREQLSPGRLMVAQALADTATLSLLQVDPHVDLQIVIRRIHMAVESRNALEQAQGMIAQRFGIDAEAALVRLRAVAEETGLTLVEVAHAVVRRDLRSPVTPILALR